MRWMSWIDGFEKMDWIGIAFWWEGRKRSSQDGHSKSPVESIIEMTTKEMRSRIQGIADSHDSSPTLRLSEESKNRRQNQQIISFHKRIHRLIQHHKRSQSSKQHPLWRDSILFSRSSVHSTTKVILHFHNVKASDTPIPHLIRTIEMKSPWNQWNQQRYYQDAEGSKMVKHNPFQLIIEKRENPNESFQLHSQGFYKQWKSESLDELAFEWVNRKQLCFGKWNNDADWTA